MVDLSGNTAQKYLSLVGGVMLTIRPQQTGASAQTFSLSNVHGDVFTTLDANGAVLGTTQTGPFGETITGQTLPTNGATGVSYGYVGKYLKATEAQLTIKPMQMGARVYLPGIGRFTSVDPVQGGTPNNYTYVTDPVNDFDLSGLCGWKFWQGACKKKSTYSKPSALGGLGHYLSGSGKALTMNAGGIKWSISSKQTLQNAGFGVIKSQKVEAMATGFNGSENIGRVTGTFTGKIEATSKGYHAVGTFTPNKDFYDFDIDKRRSLRGNVANLIGSSIGAAVSIGTLEMLSPKPYDINFSGSGAIDMYW